MGAVELLLVVFVLFVGIGFTMATTAVTGEAFWVARICFIVAAIALCAAYFVWLNDGNRPLLLRVSLGVIVGILSIVGTTETIMYVNNQETRSSIKLVPGNMPTPALPAQAQALVPKDALIVFLGSNISWATIMPHTILIMGTDKMLVIDKDKSNNNILVKVLRIFDDRNNIIARIDEDGFWVENSTRSKRPDPSSLVVFDHNDREVLHITFLNPRALSITGIFRHAGMEPVLITPEFMKLGAGGKMSQTSMGESLGGDIWLQ